MHDNVDILIIGAGLAGLSTAYHLKRDCNHLIVERENKPGGLARTEKSGEFVFDYTGHLLHLKNAYSTKLIRNLLKNNFNKKERNSWIFSKNTFTRYPFQRNTYGLPSHVIKDVILGYIKRPKIENPANFNDWIMTTFGYGIANHFLIPYNTKLWTVPPAEMTADWMGDFVPNVTIEDILDGALCDSEERVGYNAYFYYPKVGGIESLVTAFCSKLDAQKILLNDEVEKVDITGKHVYLKSGKAIKYQILISTIPLKQLIECITVKPDTIQKAASLLRYASVLNWNFAIERERFTDKDWIYLPESEFSCYRIGISSNFSRDMNPRGFTTCYTEISYLPTIKLDTISTRNKVLNDMIKIGLINNLKEIVTDLLIDIDYAYVIYDHHHRASVREIQLYLKRNDIFSIGRFGNWEYSAMEDAVLHGYKLVETLNER